MIPYLNPNADPRAAFPSAVEYVDRFLALDDDSPDEDQQKLRDLIVDMFKVGGPEAPAMCLAGVLEIVLGLIGETLGRDALSVWQETRERLDSLGLAGR